MEQRNIDVISNINMDGKKRTKFQTILLHKHAHKQDLLLRTFCIY